MDRAILSLDEAEGYARCIAALVSNLKDLPADLETVKSMRAEMLAANAKMALRFSASGHGQEAALA